MSGELENLILHTVNAIQAVNGRIEGIRQAPTLDRYPSSLDTGLLPLSIVWPDEAQTMSGNPKLRVQKRVYVVEYYFRPVGQDTLPRNQLEMSMLLGRINGTWLEMMDEQQSYILDDGEDSHIKVMVDFSEEIEDSGIRGDLFWADREMNYFGTTFRIPMLVMWGSGI